MNIKKITGMFFIILFSKFAIAENVLQSNNNYEKINIKDAYAYKIPFILNNDSYNIDVIINKDKTILLFNKQDREVYKVSVVHHENKEKDFYGYKTTKGTISIKDSLYQIKLNNNDNNLINFKVDIPEYNF